MSDILFEVHGTASMSKPLFKSLVDSFNEVFEKNIDTNFLTNFYSSNPVGQSFHSVMVHNNVVVGALTAIPYAYTYNGTTQLFTYLGGLFIKEAYRKDPLALYKMYKNLTAVLKEQQVAVLMAVPNDQSYPYFKHALKWKEVANLPYYALPVKLGNILKKPAILNIPSIIFAHTTTIVHKIWGSIVNKVATPVAIKLIPNEPLMQQHRYSNEHQKIEQRNAAFFYRVVNEDGVQTAYIIDFYNNKTKWRDQRSLTAAVQYILLNEKVDLILFIGTIGFTQHLLIKIPASKEPRALHFCVEVLDKTAINNDDINQYTNWDFGLYNFDVR